ncbi:FecCD family ABC transporter permease [Microvirga rosea]|uniref:FecCD family ABC transporter permease n=1 Tax=Microvirga rosea TaxID=2715425 RepID=UPI001D0A12A6|nr:iron ABC transporter permease [Microvirga rosea]MCB8821407.1 iron ABC transporter permease [Microvirga rosea]
MTSVTLTAVAGYRRTARRRLGLVGLGVSVLLATFLMDLSIGPGPATLRQVIGALFDPSEADARLRLVVFDLRLPIALMAVLVGAMLGLAGGAMQTILNNPLADPFTLGVSAAASVGASLALAFGWVLLPVAGTLAVTMNAFVFALMASLALFGLTKLRGVSAETMVLVGIALLFTCNALLALIQYRSNETQLQQIVFWIMGSLGRASFEKIAICVVALSIALPWMLARGWALTALRLGDERAESMGIKVDRLRLEILALVSLLAAISVAFVGAIGFVGLVGPHIARLVIGEDQRFFLPVSAVMSAVILSLASTLSKAITPGIIYPIGMITSLIGVPFFISLILSIRSRGA